MTVEYERTQHYVGTGEMFLFSVAPDERKYEWTKANPFFIMVRPCVICSVLFAFSYRFYLSSASPFLSFLLLLSLSSLLFLPFLPLPSAHRSASQIDNKPKLNIGGGSGIGIVLDDGRFRSCPKKTFFAFLFCNKLIKFFSELDKGISDRCETFDNNPLSGTNQKEFECVELEVFGIHT